MVRIKKTCGICRFHAKDNTCRRHAPAPGQVGTISDPGKKCTPEPTPTSTGAPLDKVQTLAALKELLEKFQSGSHEPPAEQTARDAYKEAFISMTGIICRVRVGDLDQATPKPALDKEKILSYVAMGCDEVLTYKRLKNGFFDLPVCSTGQLVEILRDRAAFDKEIYVSDIKAGQVEMVKWDRPGTVIMVSKDEVRS